MGKQGAEILLCKFKLTPRMQMSAARVTMNDANYSRTLGDSFIIVTWNLYVNISGHKKLEINSSKVS